MLGSMHDTSTMESVKIGLILSFLEGIQMKTEI